MRAYWRTMGPQSSRIDVFIKQRKIWGHTLGEYMQTAETSGETWKRLSLTALRRSHPRWHPDLKLLASRTMKRWVSVIEAPQFIVVCLGSPKNQHNCLDINTLDHIFHTYLIIRIICIIFKNTNSGENFYNRFWFSMFGVSLEVFIKTKEQPN